MNQCLELKNEKIGLSFRKSSAQEHTERTCLAFTWNLISEQTESNKIIISRVFLKSKIPIPSPQLAFLEPIFPVAWFESLK